MESIHEIEKKLEEAKKAKRLLSLEKELSELKTHYEGKCFGTHTFERKNRSSHASAKFYEKFWIEGYQIKMLRWSLSITRCGKNYEFSQGKLSFDRNKSEIVSSDMGYDYERKEITLNKFMRLWDYGEITSVQLNDAYTSILDQEPFDLLRLGSSNDNKILADAFSYLKLDVIDITEDYKVFNALQYKHLPFLQEQKYLPRIYAKQILEYQILEWKKEKADYSWKNDMIDNYINVITEFIKTI